jgi:hypothetical protein
MSDSESLIAKLRRPRIARITVFDTVGTIVIAGLIAKRMDWPPLQTIAIAFVIGELTHLAYDIDTPITKAIKS